MNLEDLRLHQMVVIDEPFRRLGEDQVLAQRAGQRAVRGQQKRRVVLEA